MRLLRGWSSDGVCHFLSRHNTVTCLLMNVRIRRASLRLFCRLYIRYRDQLSIQRSLSLSATVQLHHRFVDLVRPGACVHNNEAGGRRAWQRRRLYSALMDERWLRCVARA